MLVKLGDLWVESSRVDGIVPPSYVDGTSDMISRRFFPVKVMVRDVGAIEILRLDTYKESTDACDAFALIVNSCSQSSYPEEN